MKPIVKNIFINNYRKKVRANTIMDSTDNNYYLNSGKAIIANEAESSIMMEELTDLIDGLEEGIRVPFLMHYEGFKYQEIADAMGCSLSCAKIRVRRGLTKISERLATTDRRAEDVRAANSDVGE